MKKAYNYLLDTIEGLVVFALAILSLGCLIALVVAVPVLLVVSIIKQEWYDLGQLVLYGIGIFLVWQVSMRIAEKLQKSQQGS